MRKAMVKMISYASHFHVQEGRHFFDLEENAEAKVEFRSLTIDPEGTKARGLLHELWRDEIFKEPNAAVYQGAEETKEALDKLEKNRMRYVLSTRPLSQEERHSLYHGILNRNIVILLEPKDSKFDMNSHRDLLKWAKRQLAAPVTGQVVEDFRAEILGFLGSSPNYQDLYKRALIDKDYQRTEKEIIEAIEKARQASEALRDLAQDLESFNFGRYRNIKGPFGLDDLRLFVERAILRLGGAFIPQGDVFYIETPKVLHRYPNIAPRYENVVFDRKLAMRKRKADLFGLGHPLADGLIDYIKGPSFPGEVSIHEASSAPYLISARCRFIVNFDDGMKKVLYRGFYLGEDGKFESFDPKADVESLSFLRNRLKQSEREQAGSVPTSLKDRIVSLVTEEEARLRAKFDRVLSVNCLTSAKMAQVRDFG
jgi:hypothetical protein